VGDKKTWVQDTFHGGLNDLLPENDIADNEVCELVNLVAGKDGEPLAVRSGTRTLYDGLVDLSSNPLSGTVVSMYRHTLTESAALGSEFDMVATEGKVMAVDADTAHARVIHTWAHSGNNTSFATMMNKLFVTNGVDPMVAWDGTTSAPVTITDRGNNLPYIPQRLIAFRGRLWGFDNSRRRVVFSGTSDASDLIAGSTPPKYYERWRNWSGTLESDGGYYTVGDDDGQFITGIGFLYNGVVVFKERSIYLWSYAEDLHPTNVSGSTIEVLVPGVGCVSHDTIQYQDGALIFLGQNARGEYGIYRLMGQGLDDIAVKIPNKLKRVISTNSTPAKATIFRDSYIISADDYDAAGSKRTLVFAYDLKRKCWYEIAGWTVGAFQYNKERESLLIGNGNKLSATEYPFGSDDSGAAIDYRLVTRRIDGNDPMREWKWHAIAVGLNGTGGTVTIGASFDGGEFVRRSKDFTVDGVVLWDSGAYWGDGYKWFVGSTDQLVKGAVTSRATTMQIEVSGKTTKPLAIRRVAAMFKQRKVKL
jgi:hypothetical protein